MSALKTITFYAMMAAFIAAVCWLSEQRRETESPFNTAEVVWDPLWTTDLAKSHAESAPRTEPGEYSHTTTQP